MEEKEEGIHVWIASSHVCVCVCVLREGKMVDAPVVVRSPQIHTHTRYFLLLLWISALLGLVGKGQRPGHLSWFFPSRVQLNSFLPKQKKVFLSLSLDWQREHSLYCRVPYIYIFLFSTMFGVEKMKKQKMIRANFRHFHWFVCRSFCFDDSRKTFLYL